MPLSNSQQKSLRTFLDTIVYKGESFNSMLILDVGTHFKPTETFQYTHLYILPPIRGQEGLNKRWSPPATHDQNKFLKRKLSKRTRRIPKHLRERERIYPQKLITLTHCEIHFENRKETLQQRPSREKTIFPFDMQYQPSVPSLIYHARFRNEFSFFFP